MQGRVIGVSGTHAAATAVRAPIILLFTCTAGSVDAITFLNAHVFTANMTGNTALLGIYTGQGDGTAALHSLIALCSYVAGVALGVLLTGDAQQQAARALVRAVMVEAAVLAVFGAGHLASASVPNLAVMRALIGCSGVAMGIQSATVMRLQLPGVATTYITGTVTTLVFNIVRRAGGTHSAAHDESGRYDRPAALQAMVFVTYALAALTSAVLYGHWPSAVALLPVVAIASVALAMATAAGRDVGDTRS